MPDIYLYDNVPVLRNKLDIKDEKVLNLVEAEQSRTNMMLLYEKGFEDFSPAGLREIHRILFGDIYKWAGQYRIINIEKRERLLAGRSVWYSNLDYEHLERVLLDAVCGEPVTYDEESMGQTSENHANERYRKYQTEKYEPQPHYKRDS